MKKILAFSFFVLGASSVVLQVLWFREFTTSFYGNELFIGWFLFSWLFWSSVGSAWGGRAFGKKPSSFEWTGACHGLVALVPFGTVGAVRCSRMLLGQMPGALPDLVPVLVHSFLLLAPCCFLFGFQFTCGVRSLIQASTGRTSSGPLGNAYLAETLGFVAGGVLFSFVLVHWQTFTAMALVSVLNLMAIALFWTLRKHKWLGAFFSVCSAVVVVISMNAVSWETKTAQARFPSETLRSSINSIYGDIAVTQRGSQHHFYQNGVLLGADRETSASEHLVHLSMLSHPAPRKVLLLGTGFNGPLKEVLRHDPTSVCQVELDPEILGTAKGFLPSDLREALEDHRVQVRTEDPRAFLKKIGENYDVVLANLPDPTSILINRNYTSQFFRSIHARLKPGGLLTVRLGFAPDHVAPELGRLGGSVYATLGDVFPQVRVLPGETIYFLALKEGAEDPEPEKMIERAHARGIRPLYLTEAHLRDRFTNDRVGKVSSLFENMLWKVENTDARPRSYYFAFLRWLSLFHAGAARSFFSITQIPFVILLIGGLGILAVFLGFSWDPRGRRRKLAFSSMAITGFSLMAFEIVTIYLFQVAFGNLYYRLALLLSAFMTGMGAGTWLALRLKIGSGRMALAGVHALSAIFLLCLVLAIRMSFDQGTPVREWDQTFFGLFAVFSGVLGGAAFPWANDFYFSEGRGDKVGSIYAGDLLGSSWGAFLTAGFLIPIWGVGPTLAFLGAINVLMALFLFSLKDLGRKDI
ncbi:MAG: fused MFS/spermidine synthase [Candidatus Omnitrophica bacterium]|nr:fused MFS/spermidine synthase [Candidatus Omnitrophota bacterium]